ncbi:type III-B CRISPR module RAMP protein Cmr1 [Chloroflexota bacterium]|nr:type III-B CRISPR module RAMP protein Cmr1 [Chloroflexota bacterium]
MNEIQLLLEAVTPIFLFGAATGNNAQPELRGAPFRGQLRYWYRTLYPNCSSENLLRLEAQVFGSTEIGSRVSVITKPKNSRSMPVNAKVVLPHRNHGRFTLKAFSEGSQFYLTTRVKDRASIDPLLKSLLLLLNFSGVGKRVRRGFSSLKVLEMSADTIPDEYQQGLDLLGASEFKNVAEIRQHYSSLLSHVLNDRFNSSTTIAGFPQDDVSHSYPAFADGSWCALVTEQSLGNDYKEAMENFWHRHLRSDVIIDHPRDRAFGYANGGRRASPFHLHMVRAKDGFHLVLIAFNASPMPTTDSWKKHYKLYQSCLNAYGGAIFFSPERDNNDA